MHKNIKKVLHESGCDLIFSVQGNKDIQRVLKEEADAELKAYIQFDCYAIPIYVSKKYKTAFSRYIPKTFSYLDSVPHHNYFSGNILFGEEIFNALEPSELLILAIINVPKIVFPRMFFDREAFNNSVLISFGASVSGKSVFMSAYNKAYDVFKKRIDSMSDKEKDIVEATDNFDDPEYIRAIIDLQNIKFNIQTEIEPRIFIVDGKEDKVLRCCTNKFLDLDFEHGFVGPRKREEGRDDEDGCCCNKEECKCGGECDCDDKKEDHEPVILDMPCYHDVDRGADYDIDFPGDGDEYYGEEDYDEEDEEEDDEEYCCEKEYVEDETSGTW